MTTEGPLGRSLISNAPSRVSVLEETRLPSSSMNTVTTASTPLLVAASTTVPPRPAGGTMRMRSSALPSFRIAGQRRRVVTSRGAVTVMNAEGAGVELEVPLGVGRGGLRLLAALIVLDDGAGKRPHRLGREDGSGDLSAAALLRQQAGAEPDDQGGDEDSPVSHWVGLSGSTCGR